MATCSAPLAFKHCETLLHRALDSVDESQFVRIDALETEVLLPPTWDIPELTVQPIDDDLNGLAAAWFADSFALHTSGIGVLFCFCWLAPPLLLPTPALFFIAVASSVRRFGCVSL